METSQRYQVAYWDGLIIAAAERRECTRILSEILPDGQVYHGVTVADLLAKREDAGDQFARKRGLWVPVRGQLR